MKELRKGDQVAIFIPEKEFLNACEVVEVREDAIHLEVINGRYNLVFQKMIPCRSLDHNVVCENFRSQIHDQKTLSPEERAKLVLQAQIAETEEKLRKLKEQQGDPEGDIPF